jgi:hypothetical protein
MYDIANSFYFSFFEKIDLSIIRDYDNSFYLIHPNDDIKSNDQDNNKINIFIKNMFLFHDVYEKENKLYMTFFY